MREHRHAYDELSAAFKQLTAPFGQFGVETLTADSNAVESTSSGDSTYTGMDSQLQACANARDSLAARIRSVLEAAETGQQPVAPRKPRR
jgi:hypothetical protein